MDNIVFVIDMEDKRNIYLAEMLVSDGYRVEEYDCRAKYEDETKKYIVILSPSTVVDEQLYNAICSRAIIFCLKCREDMQEKLRAKGIEVCRFFDDETLAMKNAYLTAEGALALLINNTNESIRNSNILVLGYGRVGKTMAHLLKSVEANVYVATRSDIERAQASVVADYACNLIDCKKHFPYFSAIVNTIPALVVEGKDLKQLNSNCFVLDLASNPGGVDYKMAKKLGINAINALGVPGKIAPKTAAQYIRASIYRIIFDIKLRENYE